MSRGALAPPAWVTRHQRPERERNGPRGPGWWAALAALLASGCGAGVSALDTPLVVGDEAAADARLRVVRAEGQPSIAVLDREGDVVPGVAMVVYADGEPLELVGLGAWLELELERAGVDVSSTALASAVLVRTTHREPSRALRAFAAALRAELVASPELSTRIVARARRAKQQSSDHDAAIAACTGELVLPRGSDVERADVSLLARVEALRKRAATKERVAFAVVAPREAAVAAAEALHAGPTWASSSVELDRAPERDTAAAGPTLATGTAPLRLRVAVRGGDPSAAVATAARLGTSFTPLAAKLSVLAPPFEVREVTGVARPGGGCAAVTLEPARGTTSSFAAQEASELGGAVLTAARTAARELRRELAEPAPNVAARRITETFDAAEAAQLAAWWALARKVEVPTRTAYALDLPPGADAASVASMNDRLKALLSAAPTSAERPLELVGRVERGQGESWVLVASPCALADEPPHQWGDAAVAALSVAHALDGEDGVSVEAFVGASGVGFAAHAPRGAGETPSAHARRITRAAMRGFFAPSPDQEALSRGQAEARRALELRWGDEPAALDALAAHLSPAHPALLEPHGPSSALARRGAEVLARRLGSLARGPLRAAALVDGDESQLGEIRDELGRFVLDDATSSCAPGGRVELERGGFEARAALAGRARLHWAVELAATAEESAAAEAIAALLEGPDGLVARSLAEPGLSARAFVTGAQRAPRLVLSLSLPAERLEAVSAAVRELLARLSRGEIPEVELTRATKRSSASARERLAHPRERLARLHAGASPGIDDPPSATELRAFAARRLAPSAWSLLTVRPE